MQKFKNAIHKVSGSSTSTDHTTPHHQGEACACAPAAATSPAATGMVEQYTATVPVAVQQTTNTTTATAPVAAEARQTGQAAVCAQEFFTKTEDRPIVRERVELVQEHCPVEKEFVVETRATGVEREVVEGCYVEQLGTTERIVSVAPPKPPCA